jgi:hypothetical protein
MLFEEKGYRGEGPPQGEVGKKGKPRAGARKRFNLKSGPIARGTFKVPLAIALPKFSLRLARKEPYSY